MLTGLNKCLQAHMDHITDKKAGWATMIALMKRIYVAVQK